MKGKNRTSRKLLLVPVFIGAILLILELLFKPVILLKSIHFKLLIPSGLETSDKRKPAKWLSPRREAVTELGRSVWENLDLTAFGLYWRPRSRFSHTDLQVG